MVYSGNETLRLHGEALYASVQLDSKAHLVLDAPWGLYSVQTQSVTKTSVGGDGLKL